MFHLYLYLALELWHWWGITNPPSSTSCRRVTVGSPTCENSSHQHSLAVGRRMVTSPSASSLQHNFGRITQPSSSQPLHFTIGNNNCHGTGLLWDGKRSPICLSECVFFNSLLPSWPCLVGFKKKKIILQSVHMDAKGRVSFFLLAKLYSILFHHFITHSSVDGHYLWLYTQKGGCWISW